MWAQHLGVTWSSAAQGAVSAAAIYAAVIAMTRLAGQRSLASLSTFDFAVSVAIGAVIGRVALVSTTLVGGLIALGTLFVVQLTVGSLRNRHGLSAIVDNDPVIVFAAGAFLADALFGAHLSPDDVLERLRLEGVQRLDDVGAVILERSGRMSALRSDDPLDPRLLHNVVNREVLVPVVEDLRRLPGL